MRGYLSLKGRESGIPIRERTEVYRDPQDKKEIVAETDGRRVELGVADVTVSRKTGTQAPIVIEPRAESIEIRNEGNSNGVTVQNGDNEVEIEEGFLKRIQRDATLQIGYQTTLRVEVEREAREKYEIKGDVNTEGDVIMGDATKIDESTTVEDSVMNRSDIGGDGGGEVTDSVVNRSSIGGDDRGTEGRSVPEDRDSPKTAGETRQYCEEHKQSFVEQCPACATQDEDSDGDTRRYCIYCGTSMPTHAVVCPDCGKEQQDI